MQKKLTKTTNLMFACLFLIAILIIPTISTLKAQEIEEEQAENSSETTNTLRERIEKIVEQQKEKTESVLGEYPNQMRGFVGQVTRVSETTLTLDNRGVTRVVPLDENVILMRDDSEVAFDTIEIDSWTTVLGIMDNDSFSPKKITFTKNSLLPNPHVVHLGIIRNIKTRSLDFQPRGQEEIITIDLTNNTEYQNSEGEIIDLDEFIKDDQILLIGYQDNSDTVATVIRALAPVLDQNE